MVSSGAVEDAGLRGRSPGMHPRIWGEERRSGASWQYWAWRESLAVIVSPIREREV